jgi:hypothetical protein
MILAALVIGFILCLALVVGASRLDRYEEQLDREWFERWERIRRELDYQAPQPFDWADVTLREIDALPTTDETIGGLA